MNSKRKIVIVAIIALTVTAAILLPAQPAAAANLIQNGSFETYAKDPGTWSQPNIIDFDPGVGNTDIANWTVINGKIDYVQYSSYTWRAADGERSLDLCGSPGSGGVSQTFPTTVGATYEVRFSMSGNPMTGHSGDDQPNKTLRVQAAGQLADFSFDAAAEQNSFEDMKWKLCTFTFVVDSNSTTLEIFSTMESLHIGPVIDNVSVVPVQEWPIAGAWINIIPIPDLGVIVSEWTVSPQDLGGTNFTSVVRVAKPEPTVFGSFPDADHQSDHIGQTVKTGLNTYESTFVGYGTKKAELPGMLPEIVYISVLYGKARLIDENTMEGEGTHGFFLPSADADGDGLPDEGQKPIACFPYTITSKRVGLMPPCVPPPPPEPAPE